jgi:hypothetical protein
MINMMCIIHYISAGKRLKESEKTIYMMGGRDGCNEMLLAQHEMIELERDYYKEETIKLLWLVAFLFWFSVIVYGICKIKGTL